MPQISPGISVQPSNDGPPAAVSPSGQQPNSDPAQSQPWPSGPDAAVNWSGQHPFSEAEQSAHPKSLINF